MTPPTRRRGHPQCATCKLPVALKAEIAARARRGDSLTSIANHVNNEGHGIGRAGVTLHLRQCVGINDTADAENPRLPAMLLATITADAMRHWPSVLRKVSEQAAEVGMTAEAGVLMAGVPDGMRRALAATDGTPAGELLSGRLLAQAVRAVLSQRHPAAAHDIADELAQRGADDLADSLRFLGDQASLKCLVGPLSDQERAHFADNAVQRSLRLSALRGIERQTDPELKSVAMQRFQDQHGPVRLDEIAQARSDLAAEACRS